MARHHFISPFLHRLSATHLINASARSNSSLGGAFQESFQRSVHNEQTTCGNFVATQTAVQSSNVGDTVAGDAGPGSYFFDSCASLTSLLFPDLGAALFDGAKLPSMKASSTSIRPWILSSAARASRIPLITPDWTHCWNRQWQVWYDGYRSGSSTQGAPVRKTHKITVDNRSELPAAPSRADPGRHIAWRARGLGGQGSSTVGLSGHVCAHSCLDAVKQSAQRPVGRRLGELLPDGRSIREPSRPATSERNVLLRRFVRLARHPLAGRNNAISVR